MCTDHRHVKAREVAGLKRGSVAKQGVPVLLLGFDDVACLGHADRLCALSREEEGCGGLVVSKLVIG